MGGSAFLKLDFFWPVASLMGEYLLTCFKYASRFGYEQAHVAGLKQIFVSHPESGCHPSAV